MCHNTGNPYLFIFSVGRTAISSAVLTRFTCVYCLYLWYRNKGETNAGSMAQILNKQLS